MSLPKLGIDIAKRTFAAALLRDGKFRHGQFNNTQSGFTQLLGWLSKLRVSQLHAVLEATGAYGESLALFLHEAGHQVSVVNPARIKAFARSRLVRNKTDRADAAVIALFAAQQEPRLLARVERLLRPVIGLHRRAGRVELFLYHHENPRGFLWMGCVLMLSDSLAGGLSDDELAGVMAHEMGHLYFMEETVAAEKRGDAVAQKVVELKCDAVAMLTLELLGKDPARYPRGLQRILSLMRNKDLANITYRLEWRRSPTHPSVVERTQFAERFIRLLGS